jgi:hypothetical protein
MMMRGMAVEGVAREPLARSAVRAITLAVLAGLTTIARQLVHVAQGNASGFGWLAAALHLVDWLLPALAFVFVERLCDGWPRTRVAAGAATGLQTMAAIVASLAAQAQRSYVSVVLSGVPIGHAMLLAGRAFVGGLFSMLMGIALPMAVVIALLAAVRLRRARLTWQVAVVGLVPSAAVLLIAGISEAIVDRRPLSGREVIEIIVSCLIAVAWLPLAARAADLAAARVARERA